MSLTSLYQELLDLSVQGLHASALWLRVSAWFCLLGALAALVSLGTHFLERDRRVRTRAPAGPARSNRWSRIALAGLCAAALTTLVSVWNRGLEVNHFPSQNMTEVLVMFSLSLLCSMIVLYFALPLRKLGPGWAQMDDALLASVLIGNLLCLHYAASLPNAQRDLPPALQSYWFPPHLVSLIFSYATLGIAGLLCAIYFGVRFWSGCFSGGRSLAAQLGALALLVLVPFTQVVTIPLFLLIGLVFLGLRLSGKLPGAEALRSVERTIDDVSFRAFAVGIPFLTAGVFQGAFWAQEAWANYWGWDSKENSALITWLVYVGYVHLRLLGGYRGEKAMGVLLGGALSIFVTFQVFGYLPDSQKSMHNYTETSRPAKEGQQGMRQEQARVESEAESAAGLK